VHPTTVDWVALGIVALCAVLGMRRGLIASALSLAGLVVGAYVGARVAPHLLHGGSTSPWAALAGLAGAVAGALLGQALAGILGSFVRGGLRLTPFRFLDSAGGFVLGAVAGLALVWVIGATALLIPGQTRYRQEAEKSQLLKKLNGVVPPRQLLHLLARIDPFPSIAGPEAPTAPSSGAIARDSDVAAATRSVVRVLGTSCGVGVEGSGWFVSPHLVVTAAHVVAGEGDTVVVVQGRARPVRARAVAFDAHNDVAVLRVVGARGTPLRIVDPRPGTAVAIVGYPENGPLRLTPGRVGHTQVVLTQDAYGHGPVPRTITAVAGRVQHGDSGGPAIDGSGAVQSTMFAARIGGGSGYGVPGSLVRRALDSVRGTVSTGSCGG
jgi:uncharacterized membrane protein required for colicin V production